MVKKFESFSNDKMTIDAMNKALYFFADCGINDVKKILYNSFDEDLAEHILSKYNNCYSEMPFLELYFQLDDNCKKEILLYIAHNYENEQKLP